MQKRFACKDKRIYCVTMESKDSLGDRQKGYEMAEAGRQLIPLLPIMVRLDGKAFHTFTQGLTRPYDQGMSTLMGETTKYLVEQTGALLGYTQSDEITLVIYQDNTKSQVFFNGRIQKLTSVIASMCTAYFNSHLDIWVPDKKDQIALFDCRVWNVPTLTEAANAVLWRELDATKNAITMAASTFYSHKKLDGKNGKEKQEMLFARGVNFNDYPSFFKKGTYFLRRKKSIPFTAKEIDKLPLKHMARTNPELCIERSVIEKSVFPQLTRCANKTGFLFLGEDFIPIEDP